MFRNYFRAPALFLCVVSSLIHGISVASDVEQLKATLAQYTADQDIQLAINYEQSTSGEVDDEQQQVMGKMSFRLSHLNGAVSLSYPEQILAQARTEQLSKRQDEQDQTPTLEALERMNLNQLNGLMNAAPLLVDWINEGSFSHVEVTELGKRLHFAMPLDSVLDGRIKKYVRKFTCQLAIDLDENGTPTNASMRMQGKGSAFIFFSMKATSQTDIAFKRVGDRLIQVSSQRESYHRSTFSEGNSSRMISAAVL